MGFKALRNMKKCIKYIVLGAIVAVPICVNAMAAPAKGDSIVALNKCKLYKTASTSQKVGYMQKGLVRNISKVSGKFYKVKIDGKSVWVHRNNVIETDEIIINVTAKKDCRVYSQANTYFKLYTLYAGMTRKVLDYSGNYYRIKLNGKKGWVRMNTGDLDIKISLKDQEEPSEPTEPTEPTEPENPTDKYSAIASLVKSKVGCSYVYGGAGPDKFDASGLVYYCYRENGIMSVPRSTAAQYNSCIKVSRSELKPGYLVFFDGSGDKVADFVGIYVGDGQFVSAGNTNTGVTLNSLTSNYYNTHYVDAGYFK